MIMHVRIVAFFRQSYRQSYKGKVIKAKLIIKIKILVFQARNARVNKTLYYIKIYRNIIYGCSRGNLIDHRYPNEDLFGNNVMWSWPESLALINRELIHS
jgi:hypothetical protein